MKRLLPLVLLAAALAASALAAVATGAGGRIVHLGASPAARVAAIPSPGGRFEGRVAALGTSTVTVVSRRLDLVLNVPAGSDLRAVAVGDEVLATFAQQPDGTLTLTALSFADDERGGDGGDRHGGGRHGGGGGSRG
jgi:hypothetical protein